MQEYMEEVKGVLSMYVPPESQKMEQAYQAGNLSLNPAGGLVNLVFTELCPTRRSNDAHFRLQYKKDRIFECEHLHG